jgi:hypothetical protein
VKFGLVGFPLGQIYSTVDRPPRETVATIARLADEWLRLRLRARSHPCPARVAMEQVAEKVIARA